MAIDLDRLTNTVGKLRKLLKKKSGLLTPEQVHDLRTRIRRVEASVNALQLNKKNNERQVLSRLKRIRKNAGKVRDMDVLTSDLLGIQMEDHRDCAVRLIQHLGAERHALAKTLRRSIKRYGAKARQRLKKTSRHMEKSIQGDAHAASQETMAGKALQLSTQLASPPHLNRRNLHPYRLKVKELRYVLQAANESGNKRFVDVLGQTKDAIGDWHDWEELIAIAKNVLDDASLCPLVDRMTQISRNKYQSALTTAQKMRTEVISRAPRKKHGSKPAAIRPPALKAVAAIAS